jgi:hypothetical protein
VVPTRCHESLILARRPRGGVSIKTQPRLDYHSTASRLQLNRVSTTTQPRLSHQDFDRALREVLPALSTHTARLAAMAPYGMQPRAGVAFHMMMVAAGRMATRLVRGSARSEGPQSGAGPPGQVSAAASRPSLAVCCGVCRRSHCDAKVANREIRVWHLVIENGD